MREPARLVVRQHALAALEGGVDLRERLAEPPPLRNRLMSSCDGLMVPLDGLIVSI